MLKPTIFILWTMCCSLNAMETFDMCTISEWRKTKLEILNEHSKTPTKDEKIQKARRLLKRFVEICLDKQDVVREQLSQLSLKTGGVIRETSDSDLVAEDVNKFLHKNALEFTSNEIDERWESIKKLQHRQFNA
jgi:hypothetical protein